VDWPLLRPLEEDDRRRVLSAASRHRYRRGEAIFREGDRGDSLHLLDKGHVAVQMTTPLGDVLTLAVLGPGEMFGELAALSSQSHRTATIRSLDRTETLVISGEHFTELRRRHPSLNELLLELASAHIPRLSGQLVERSTCGPTSGSCAGWSPSPRSTVVATPGPPSRSGRTTWPSWPVPPAPP
jgi:CRP/FNR family transcriptional regulator, cyclic AMP receptor protein